MAKIKTLKKITIGAITYPRGTCIIVGREVEKRLLKERKAVLADFVTINEIAAMDAARDKVVKQAMNVHDTLLMITETDDLDTLMILTTDERKTVRDAAAKKIEKLTPPTKQL